LALSVLAASAMPKAALKNLMFINSALFNTS